MIIELKGYLREFNQRALVSGDKGQRLTFHELVLDQQNTMLLAVAPTNQIAEIKIEFKDTQEVT